MRQVAGKALKVPSPYRLAHCAPLVNSAEDRKVEKSTASLEFAGPGPRRPTGPATKGTGLLAGDLHSQADQVGEF